MAVHFNREYFEVLCEISKGAIDSAVTVQHMFNPIQWLEACITWLLDRAEGSKSPRGYRASFGRASKILKRRHKGFNLGAKHNISKESSYKGALVIGATGSGKSQTCLIPSIRSMDGSLIIHDPSGELLEETKKDLKVRGYDVKVFNPSNPRISQSFNFLADVKTAGDASRKARSIVEANYGANLSFWETSALDVISTLITYLSQTSGVSCNLPELLSHLKLVSSDPHSVARQFKATGDVELTKRIMTFLHQEEKMRSGVLATALSCLTFLSDEKVLDITNSNSLELGSIRRTKTALFIQSKTTDTRYHSVLNSLLFERLFEVVLERLPFQYEEDVFVLLDEAGGLTIPMLPLAMANVRKYRCGILLAIQDYNQLIARYGHEQAHVIRSNVFSTLVFGGVGLQEAQFIEKLCGTTEITDARGYLRTVPLISAPEIRVLPRSSALLLHGNEAPMKIRVTRSKPLRMSRFAVVDL